MKAVPFTAALVLAFAAAPVLAQPVAEPAPAGLSAKAAKEWVKLARDETKLNERIVKDEERLGDAQADVAKAASRLIDAQEKLRREERELEKLQEKLADRRADMAQIAERRARMRQAAGLAGG